MCGIVGILHQKRSIQEYEINAVTDAVQSRGPDEKGIWIEKNKALGHRRLSIIDIEDGHQPIFTEDKKFGIVFNGEIYNYKELKKILKQRGYQFRTHSDTEVLLYSYVEWREKCVNKLRGMFAFAVVDNENQEFFLARDHMGIKPLVYYYTKETFAFASEIRALKKVENSKFTLDISAIDEYLWLQYIPAPKTAFNEVKKLKPAHYMKVSFAGKIIAMHEYWDISFKPDIKKTEDEWIEELDSVLKDSVKAHLVADVPFGAFLSGGIDSSLIVKYMSELLERKVETFSIGFQEEAFNELEYARDVSRKFDTCHHEEIITPDTLAILPNIVSHYGEPFGDSSVVPTYYVSKLARKNVPMVLSGDGADEIFAGYQSYKRWMEYLQGGDTFPRWKKILRPLVEAIMPDKYPPRLKYGDKLENWLTFIQYMSQTKRHSLWKKDYQNMLSSDIEIFACSFNKTRELDFLTKVMYTDIKTYLPYDILTKVDVASMMHGLEVRTPFIDKNVYEFAARIPSNINFSKVKGLGNQGKLLLKKLLQKDMTEKFVYRKKMGFAMPLKEWFHGNGDYFSQLNERLLSPESKLLEYFERNEIEKMIQNNQFNTVWLLLFLEEWLRQEEVVK